MTSHPQNSAARRYRGKIFGGQTAGAMRGADSPSPFFILFDRFGTQCAPDGVRMIFEQVYYIIAA